MNISQLYRTCVIIHYILSYYYFKGTLERMQNTMNNNNYNNSNGSCKT